MFDFESSGFRANFHIERTRPSQRKWLRRQDGYTKSSGKKFGVDLDTGSVRFHRGFLLEPCQPSWLGSGCSRSSGGVASQVIPKEPEEHNEQSVIEDEWRDSEGAGSRVVHLTHQPFQYFNAGQAVCLPVASVNINEYISGGSTARFMYI